MNTVLNMDKFIVFKIAEYLLALPISHVLKVVNFSSVVNQGLNLMGVVHLGTHTIQILDLHEQLAGRHDFSPRQDLPSNQQFLVITRTSQGELCGIVVNEPPNLVEIDREMIRSLPHSSNQKSALECVSHAAVITEEGVTTTIFLLDVERSLNIKMNQSQLLKQLG
jgi:purine-binding chemotaxis protein CheW